MAITRFAAVFFVIILSLLCLTPDIFAAEAEDLTSGCRILPSDTTGTGFLIFNGSTQMGLNVKKGTRISFEASKPIRSLYLEWDTPHARWDFVTSENGENGGETRKTYGENGFLREYADLGASYDSVTLEFYGSGAILLNIYAFSEGDVPDWVQIWQPTLEKADMLVLPVRAGDEFLYFGGAIPYYVEKGKSVQVAYMTNLFAKPGETLELLDALYAAGVRAYPVISDFSETAASDLESALAHYNEDDVIAFVTELLRRFKPEVVVGQGEYGDGVQELSFLALTVAAELSDDAMEYRESASEYGIWSVPKLYLHAYGENMIEMGWGAALDTAMQSFSQYSWRQNRSILTDGAYDCEKFGLYRSTVGADKEKNDLFENIVPVSSVAEESEATPEHEAKPESNVTDNPVTPPNPLQTYSKSESVGNLFAHLVASPAAMPIAATVMIVTAILLLLKKD